jgi:hypothetical protein
MKRRRVLTGVAAAIGAGGLLLTGALPSTARTTASQQETVQATAVAAQAGKITFVTRAFDCYGVNRCSAFAQLPKTWKHIRLGRAQDRFKDPARDRMIRFNVDFGGRVNAATAMKQKQAALQGTRGLRVLGTSTVRMQSTTGMGPQTVSTIVYTYRRGNTTRWVATRYIEPYGSGAALIEITVAGAPKDRRVLGTVLNRATQTISLPS